MNEPAPQVEQDEQAAPGRGRAFAVGLVVVVVGVALLVYAMLAGGPPVPEPERTSAPPAVEQTQADDTQAGDDALKAGEGPSVERLTWSRAHSNGRAIALLLMKDAEERYDPYEQIKAGADEDASDTIWLRGVDVLGRATADYDGPTIMNQLIGDKPEHLKLALAYGKDAPNGFFSWPDDRRIQWLRDNMMYDFVLPADSTRWSDVAHRAGDFPVLVMRREHAVGDAVIIAYLDGMTRTVMYRQALELSQAMTGRSASQLRERPTSDFKAESD